VKVTITETYDIKEEIFKIAMKRVKLPISKLDCLNRQSNSETKFLLLSCIAKDVEICCDSYTIDSIKIQEEKENADSCN